MTITNTVEKIRSFYEEDIATRIPFDLHPLQHATDYQKQLYGTMLAMLIQYENDAQKEQTVLLQRIMKGAGIELTLQQLLQNAKTADEKFAKDFYDEFTNNDLARNFTVDALMLVYALAPIKEKQLTFVSELVSVLNIDLEMFQLLVQFTKAILTQNSDEIYEVFASKPTLKLLNQFEYYYAPILDTSVEKVYELLKSEQDVLIFTNIHFTPNMNVNIFSNKKLLLFKNCIFSDFDTPLLISNINSVILDNCILKNSKNNIFECHYVENIYIFKCLFHAIEKKIHSLSYGVTVSAGGIFTSNTECNVYIFNSVFDAIYLSSTSRDSDSSTYANGLILGSTKIRNYHLQDNQFKLCRFTSKRGGSSSCLSESNHTSDLNLQYKNIQNANQKFLKDVSFVQFIHNEYSIDLNMSTTDNNEYIECTPNKFGSKTIVW